MVLRLDARSLEAHLHEETRLLHWKLLDLRMHEHNRRQDPSFGRNGGPYAPGPDLATDLQAQMQLQFYGRALDNPELFYRVKSREAFREIYSLVDRLVKTARGRTAVGEGDSVYIGLEYAIYYIERQVARGGLNYRLMLRGASHSQRCTYWALKKKKSKPYEEHRMRKYVP